MKKKKIIVGICIVIGLLLILMVIKLNYIKKYEINFITENDYEELQKGLEFKDKIVIPKENSNNEYLEYENMKIRNDFNDFIKQDDITNLKTASYMLYKDNKAIASFSMSITNSYIDYLKSDGVTYYNVDDKKTTLADREYFLKKNKIKNDIDLFNYFNKHNLPNSNIFTSNKKIKANYAAYLMGVTMIPKVNYLTKIEGKYNGYVFNLDKATEVSILKNNKRYVFLFMGREYFTNEYVKELIKTIVID